MELLLSRQYGKLSPRNGGAICQILLSKCMQHFHWIMADFQWYCETKLSTEKQVQRNVNFDVGRDYSCKSWPWPKLTPWNFQTVYFLPLPDCEPPQSDGFSNPEEQTDLKISATWWLKLQCPHQEGTWSLLFLFRRPNERPIPIDVRRQMLQLLWTRPLVYCLSEEAEMNWRNLNS